MLIPDANAVAALYSEVTGSTSRLPMCGNYRLPPYEKVDINALNAELAAICSDYDAITDCCSDIDEYASRLDPVIATWERHMKRYLSDSLSSVYSSAGSTYLEGATVPIEMGTAMNSDLSTVAVTSDGTAVLPVISNISFDGEISVDDISVAPLATNLSSVITGSPHLMFADEPSPCTLTLTGPINQLTSTARQEGFRITVIVGSDAVDHLLLVLDTRVPGTRVTVKVENIGGSVTSVFEEICTSGDIDVVFERQYVAKIITIESSSPASVLPGSCVYEWTIKKIVLDSRTYLRSGIYQTNAIPLTSGPDLFYLAHDDNRYGDTTVTYYATLYTDDDGNPTGFAKVTDGVPISIGNPRLNLAIKTTNTDGVWRPFLVSEFGNRLYSVISVSGTPEITDGLTVSGDRLLCSGSVSINEDRTMVYRGVGDWAIMETSEDYIENVEAITSRTRLSSDSTWIQPIELNYRVVDEPAIYAGSPSVITTRYPVGTGNLQDIMLRTGNGNSYRPTVTVISGSTVTLSSALDDNNDYYITYVTPLSNITAGNRTIINESDIVVHAGDTRLSPGTDFTVFRETDSSGIMTYSVSLKASGAYGPLFSVDTSSGAAVNMSPNCSISYTVTHKNYSIVPYYETWVQVSMDTDIDLYPFMPGEIAAGNFHRINSRDFSTASSAVLSPGWNRIQSTQPYPTGKTDGNVNPLTGGISRARIDIPPHIERMRAFKDPLNQVSPFNLACISGDDRYGAYALYNGRLLLARVPEFIPLWKCTSSDVCQYHGPTLLARRPVIDTDGYTTAWLPHPEEFEMAIATTGGVASSLYVKIVMEAGRASFARVRKLGINYGTIE
jgi:hypothetical protein